MSACARCRWGPGTTKERTPNTESAKQLESSLQSLLAARTAQDSYFVTESSVIDTTVSLGPSLKRLVLGSDSEPSANLQSSNVKIPTYTADKSLQIPAERPPQVAQRSQLMSSMNFGVPPIAWDWPPK